jgi:hypothetical protein
MQGCAPKLRTNDLQQKLTVTRESDPTFIGSRETAPAQG